MGIQLNDDSIDKLIEELKVVHKPGRKAEPATTAVRMYLYKALKIYGACLCEHQYKYHGKIIKTCGRCKAMIAYELLTFGHSETLTDREKEIPKG